MKLGILSNNNLNKQNILLKFQGKRFSPRESTLKDIIGIESGTTKSLSPTKAKKAILVLLSMVKKNSPELQQARFEVACSEVLDLAKRTFKRADASPEFKKEVIDKLCALQTAKKKISSTIVSDYINKTLVTHIVETKDAELADYLLAKSQIPKNKRSADSILKRIELITKIGDATYAEELKTYINCDGLPDYLVPAFMKEGHPVACTIIAKSAKNALKAVSEKPRFD